MLGDVVSGSKGHRVYVADCVPVIWDRDRGGAPFLDDEQRRVFERELSTPRPAQNMIVVGYYRADLAHPALTGTDVDLLDRYFPNLTDLCLLIRREQAGAHAAVFLRTHGEFRAGTSVSDLEFPLYRLEARDDPESLGGRRFPGAERHLFLTAAAWTAGIALIAIMSRGIWSESLQGRPAEVAPTVDVPDPFVYAVAASTSPLELEIDHSQGELKLLWNSQSQAVRSARCGSLVIDEGGRRKTLVELSSSTLKGGAFPFKKAGANLSFQMNVLTTDGRLFSSAVRVLDGTVPDGYSPLSARFAPPQEAENSIARVALPSVPGARQITSSSGFRNEGLCGDPASPVPGGKPTQVTSARTVGGPAFVLPFLAQPLDQKLYISLEVFLNEQGAITDVQGPVSAAYREISRLLTQKVRQWRYTPATVDGAPLANSIKFSFAIKQGRWE